MKMKYSIDMLKQEYSDDDFIFFWGHTPSRDGYLTQACLSQWWLCVFMENGILFSCAEQYMMYKKALLFKDYKHAQEILITKTPKRIKELGRLVEDFDDEIWNTEKEKIVLRGNLLKFSQNSELRNYLTSTGNKILVEASPYDKVWGIGMKSNDDDICDPGKWQGKNLLGFLLMETRDRVN